MTQKAVEEKIKGGGTIIVDVGRRYTVTRFVIRRRLEPKLFFAVSKTAKFCRIASKFASLRSLSSPLFDDSLIILSSVSLDVFIDASQQVARQSTERSLVLRGDKTSVQTATFLVADAGGNFCVLEELSFERVFDGVNWFASTPMEDDEERAMSTCTKASDLVFKFCCDSPKIGSGLEKIKRQENQLINQQVNTSQQNLKKLLLLEWGRNI
uniref:Uncharacterized protein n=1 Tax=Romanomermis culicivorax TaxID=13658 RepID=A0A915K258_ROMCU